MSRKQTIPAGALSRTSIRERGGKFSRGEKHDGAQLTEDEVRTIVALLGQVSQRELARHFGVDPSTIAKISTRKNWGWLAKRLDEDTSG